MAYNNYCQYMRFLRSVSFVARKHDNKSTCILHLYQAFSGGNLHVSSGLPRYLKLPWTQANYLACSAVSYQQYISLDLSATKKAKLIQKITRAS